MSLKKYIALVFVVIALGAGAYFSQKAFLASQDIPAAVRDTPMVSSTASVTPATPTAPTPSVAQKPQSAPNITLSVGSSTYAIYAPEHSSVLNAMKTLASTNALSFSGKEFPSLGMFIDSINGRKNAGGYYWILYVNGTSSDTGASQTTLEEGDFVEWRYERGY
ncbi:MAG: DUF4430 domain-containing protein [Patescibacteria group bacterium]